MPLREAKPSGCLRRMKKEKAHEPFACRHLQEEIEETLESFVDNRYVKSSDELDILINSISPLDFQVGIPNDGHVLKRDHTTGKWKKINQHQSRSKAPSPVTCRRIYTLLFQNDQPLRASAHTSQATAPSSALLAICTASSRSN